MTTTINSTVKTEVANYILKTNEVITVKTVMALMERMGERDTSTRANRIVFEMIESRILKDVENGFSLDF